MLTSAEKALQDEADCGCQIYMEEPFPSRWLHELVQTDPIRPSGHDGGQSAGTSAPTRVED